MGVKMFEARYGSGIINLKKYKDEMNGKISCRYCETPITYVKEHIREVGECDVHKRIACVCPQAEQNTRQIRNRFLPSEVLI